MTNSDFFLQTSLYGENPQEDVLVFNKRVSDIFITVDMNDFMKLMCPCDGSPPCFLVLIDRNEMGHSDLFVVSISMFECMSFS